MGIRAHLCAQSTPCDVVADRADGHARLARGRHDHGPQSARGGSSVFSCLWDWPGLDLRRRAELVLRAGATLLHSKRSWSSRSAVAIRGFLRPPGWPAVQARNWIPAASSGLGGNDVPIVSLAAEVVGPYRPPMADPPDDTHRAHLFRRGRHAVSGSFGNLRGACGGRFACGGGVRRDDPARSATADEHRACRRNRITLPQSTRAADLRSPASTALRASARQFELLFLFFHFGDREQFNRLLRDVFGADLEFLD